MNKTQMNLQDVFLNQVRKEGAPVTVYLVGGVQLKGMVKGFDAFTVVLESQGKPPQLIYKHAIASVVPMRPIGMREIAAERERGAKLSTEGAAAPEEAPVEEAAAPEEAPVEDAAAPEEAPVEEAAPAAGEEEQE
jgi:host factor-I protein